MWRKLQYWHLMLVILIGVTFSLVYFCSLITNRLEDYEEQRSLSNRIHSLGGNAPGNTLLSYPDFLDTLIAQLIEVPYDFIVDTVIFDSTGVTLSELQTNCTNLFRLHDVYIINEPFFDDEAVKFVSGFSTIRRLSIDRCPITDQGVSHLVSLRNLASLSLEHNSKLTPKCLNYIVQLPSLESVYLPRHFTVTVAKSLARRRPNLHVYWVDSEGIGYEFHHASFPVE